MKSRSRYRFGLGRFIHVKGACWAVALPDEVGEGDGPGSAYHSSLVLLEDGYLLGPGHAVHEMIAEKGKGLFSHWGDTLYFSSSDNSDPNVNGRKYEVLSLDLVLPSTDAAKLAALSIDALNSRDEERRFSSLEELVSVVMPKYQLADWGRDYVLEEKLVSLYRRFESSFRSYDRKFNAYHLISLTRDVPGDLVECGVYRGAMSRFIGQAMLDNGIDAGLHLIDSFEGLSSPGENDGDYWRAGDMSAALEEVKSNLSDISFIKYHSGWIPEVFSSMEDGVYRFLHLDLDLYQPTRDALEYFYPRMKKGAVILCDDYGFMTCKGAKMAIDEYFGYMGEKVVALSSGQAFIIKQEGG